MFGQGDLLLIGGVILLLFGPGKIPELMKGLGKGMKEFKKAQSDIEDEFKKIVDAPEETGKPKETITTKTEQSDSSTLKS